MARIKTITFASDPTYSDPTDLVLNAAGDAYVVGGVSIAPGAVQETCQAILELVDQPADGITTTQLLVEESGHILEMDPTDKSVGLTPTTTKFPEAKIRDFVAGAQLASLYTPA